MMMINYILQGFKERVNQMDWLSDLSKQRSIEKVEAITSQAAYPVQIFDNDYVNGLYSRVNGANLVIISLVILHGFSIHCNTNLYSFIQFTANPNDFYGNRLRSAELDLRLRLNLTYGFDKTAWPTNPNFLGYPTLVNAAYNRQGNQICKLAYYRRILYIHVANNINTARTRNLLACRQKFSPIIMRTCGKIKFSFEKISAMVMQYLFTLYLI